MVLPAAATNRVLGQKPHAGNGLPRVQNPGAGAVVQVQLWTRDPLNTSAQKTILSNALQFTVMP